MMTFSADMQCVPDKHLLDNKLKSYLPIMSAIKAALHESIVDNYFQLNAN